jgi:hypothetical protein
MVKWRVDGRDRVGNKTAAYERLEVGWKWNNRKYRR